MKSLNIDVIFPWEVGLVLAIMGLIFIIIGVRQSKKEIDDFDKIPLTKPTTKILLGSFLCIFGLIQMLPLLSNF
jgi:hypothetical protein